MTFLHSIILGLVEGLTEYLPISSTAHMEIASRLLHLVDTDFLKSFLVIIQFGAILAVVVLYFNRFKKSVEVWKRVIAAFIPTGIIGFILYKIIKNYFLGNFILMLWMLLLGGVVLIVFEIMHTEPQKHEEVMRELETMPYSHAIIIGVMQSLAVVPGVSRSAASIVTGMALGMRRVAIVEFSFLLAIPTILAASGYDLLKNHSSFSGDQATMLIVGFIAAFISAYVAIKLFLGYVQKNTFIPFGVYRIVLALVLFGTM